MIWGAKEWLQTLLAVSWTSMIIDVLSHHNGFRGKWMNNDENWWDLMGYHEGIIDHVDNAKPGCQKTWLIDHEVQYPPLK